MTKILQFPEDRSLRNKLDGMREDLEELYDVLNRIYQAVDNLETDISKTESTYNEVLELYANAVGIENIEVGYLEYATKNLKVSEDGISWEKEPDEVVFTPWEEDKDET